MSSRVNILAPDFRADPYPVYARLRREAPVSLVDPVGMWAISRYEDALYVMKNPQLFSSRGIMAATEPPWLGRTNPVSDSLIAIDPPRHTRLRALVNRAFTPAAVARLEPFVRTVVEELASKVVSGNTLDFVETFALPLPANVIGELLGLDVSLRARFKQWADIIITAATLPPDAVELHDRMRNTLAEMDRYFHEVVESRRRQPGDDMVSELLRAQVDGQSLSESELMGFFYLLLLAGLETTVHMLSHCAIMLARKPDVQARLRAEPALIPRFIEEVLRCEPPVHSTLRVTTSEVELSGVKLPPGTPVLVLLASAQRDENFCPNGDEFSLERTNQGNMAFGHGIHFCLGAPLARLEARVALEVLLSRSSGIFLRQEQIQWNLAPTARGPVVLPMEWKPR
ncbi:cytochrome P450 [Archangium violaceum]|uniref:cytochrome P450 n=1 Tax=Archangium violaceum TaxID=83451 RepID=UPI002B3114E7|nr:cytochrome P450 [Archangium violaceum]